MRKIYVTLFAFSLSYMSFGQDFGKQYEFGTRPKITSPKTTPSEVVKSSQKPVSVVSEKAFNVLWTEDFGTSTTGLTTTNGTWVQNTAPADSAYWSIGQTHPFSAFGWSDLLSGSFLRWDSYNPIDAVETSFASTPVSGAVVSPNIDLSTATNGAMLSFKTEAMYCCHSTEIPFKISISQDGGTTWSNPISLDFGVDRNVATEDIAQPLNYTLDISSYTSLLSTNTKIKFIWSGLNVDGNGQANSHYFWLIDDIQIYERPDYDFQIVDMWLNDIITDYEYTRIPQNFAGTLTVQAKVRNLGKLLPPNTQLALTVTGTGVNTTQSGGVLTNNFTGEYDTITFASTIDMSAYAVGSYSVNAKLISDQPDADTTNNKYLRTFEITNNTYGQQDFEQPLYKASIGKDFGEAATATDPATSVAMGFGSVFYIPTEAVLHGLNLKIGKSTTYPTIVGGEIYVQLYLYDMTASTFNTAHIYEAGDWSFPITSAMVPTANTGASSIKDVTLNFHATTAGIPTLLADNYYIAVVRHDGGSNNHFCYVENPFDDDNSTHIYGGFASTPGDNWFTAGTQIITEMNFDNSLSTNELNNDVTFGFISPNPTSGETTIAYSLKNSQDATIEVMDLTGKCVYSITEKALSTGTHFTNFDASKLSSGVYCVNIKTANSISTQKFVKK